jgi:hypothetical protein
MDWKDRCVTYSFSPFFPVKNFEISAYPHVGFSELQDTIFEELKVR